LSFSLFFFWQAEVDANCQLFIEINEACGSAMTRCGEGIQWGSDAVLCARDWTKPDDLTADCADALAKIPSDKPVEVEEESEETKAKKAKRKAARKRAANDVRNL
jgi:hypothetical protein